ncbi:MAG: hypothetical protein M1814_005549 [Vezdaea aestivalis]|nr:MAG: hypothetical protein M1814_005549 [Vezdaea aestivalis]
MSPDSGSREAGYHVHSVDTEADPDLNNDRRKRRKTDSPRPDLVDTRDSASMAAPNEQECLDSGQWMEPAQKSDKKSSVKVPSRMLQLNSNGTLDALVRKVKPTEPPKSDDKPIVAKRGRPKLVKKHHALLVRVRYGSDSESRKLFSNRIETILNGGHPIIHPTAKPAVSTSQTSSKALHPFFTRNQERITTEYGTVNERSKRTESSHDPERIEIQQQELKSLDFTRSSNLNPVRCQKSAEHQSANVANVEEPLRHTKGSNPTHPIWPCYGILHCRGHLDPVPQSKPVQAFDAMSRDPDFPSILQPSKLKVRCVGLNRDEHLFTRLSNKAMLAEQLNVSRIPDGLGLPSRHLVSGHELYNIVSNNLEGASNDSGGRPETAFLNERRRMRLARNFSSLDRLPREIETSLTPFDRSRRESQAWVNKYSPKCASDVLQYGREAILLRDWLQRLTVTSVDTKSASATKPEKPKKRKKPKDLDDFIVESDESDGHLSELSDMESSIAIHRVFGPKTTIKSSKTTGQRNAAVLSGPPGCGKTATIMAVARELNFEVFEINAGSRRSGRDVLESVGDMTKNHLVQHSIISPGTFTSASQTNKDTTTEKESGQQDMVKPFFKTRGTAIPPPRPPTAKGKKSVQRAISTKVPLRSQKQSLILLEEVDVLFEEDKQFWTTVLELIEQSKRPVIMTCNDESLLPLDALNLHAIFRFSPPPQGLVIDYLLLLAANEGHIIQREAAESLLHLKGGDLRASIMDLDFWCQMGIGDRKGGLEWIFQRWPVGSDIDSDGRRLRVASNNSLTKDVLWPCAEGSVSKTGVSDEKILEAAWTQFGLDPSDWAEENVQGQSHTWLSRTDISLTEIAQFLDTISAADIHPGPALRSSNFTVIDPSIPKIHDKVAMDRMDGFAHLHAVPLAEHDQLSQAITFELKALSRQTVSPTRLTPRTFKDWGHLEQTHSDVLRSLAPLSQPHPAAFPGYNPTYAEVLRARGTVASEVAPYVRAIARADVSIASRRRALNTLLSEGGRPPRKVRNTRASRSALEGGVRSKTRREKWFGGLLRDPKEVLDSGGEGWGDQSYLRVGFGGDATEDQSIDEAQSPRSEESESSGIDS